MSRKCCPCCSVLIASICLAVVGILIACLNFGAMPLYKGIVKKKLVMKKGSMTYKNWEHAPLPVYMNYYIFNYTNLEEIKNGSKPIIKELGPYAYREDRTNEVSDMNENEITYKQLYSYTFDPNMSCPGCSESDMIYTPNIPFMSIVKILAGANVTEHSDPSKTGPMIFFGKIFSAALDNEGADIFYHHNISQLLWGYHDNFLAAIQAESSSLPPSYLKALNISFPSNLDTTIQLQHNGTEEAEYFGNFTLKTGKEDIDDLQRIVKWRGSDEVPHWLTKYGRMINGTDGTHFQPFVTKSDQLYAFIPDICRSIYIVYDQEDSVQDIDLYRYTTDEYSMLNHTANPDNEAFCVGGCGPSGIIPIGQCQDGDPPVYASGVHFYQSDPALFEAVDGLSNPDKEKHATLISVEPDTGTTMKANKRLQINVKAEYVEFFPKTYGFPKGDGIYFPVFYVDEEFKLDEANAKTFKDEVTNPKKYIMVFRWVLVGLGGFLILLGVTMYVCHTVRNNDAEDGYKKFSGR